MQQHTAIEMVLRNNTARLYMFDSRAECERAWGGLAKTQPDLLIQACKIDPFSSGYMDAWSVEKELRGLMTPIRSQKLVSKNAPPTQEWQEWEGISRQWQCGGISNFHYLLHLNGMAQRSFSDLAQVGLQSSVKCTQKDRKMHPKRS